LRPSEPYPLSAISMHSLTTRPWSLADDLLAYAANGVRSVALWEGKVRNDYFEDDVKAWRAAGLRCSSLTPIGCNILWSELDSGPRDVAGRVRMLEAGLERMSPFAPEFIVLVTGPHDGISRRQAAADVRGALVRLGAVAQAIGARLALEPIHPSMPGFSFVSDLDETAEFIDAIGLPEIGIVADTYHLWDRPDALDQLRRHVSRIATVQVADWRDPPRSWLDRCLPGDGCADLVGMVAELLDAGYRGYFELEILSDDGSILSDLPDSLWRWTPAQITREGVARMHTMLEAASCRANIS
jgi:sugar phosphate isomerase/epimerase